MNAKRAQKQRRQIVAYAHNILAIYLDCDDLTRAAGSEWYALERQRCADFGRRVGVPADRVAGAAAAISPGLRYETTFAYLSALLRDPKAAVPTYNRANVNKALAILSGESPLAVLGGDKVRAFYGLLSGTDLGAVVIDGHAINIARLKISGIRSLPAAARVTPTRYRLAAAAYREVADLVGVPAHAVQAATWIHWRNLITQFERQPGED